ncbi:universal stress protein [Haloarcula nitratireducens]|uniref:Universal stress protein n=1 Tax=Haloarcula nitratireducens TaxID=2487749 RepID=A0AAW4PJ83_9EURY|nr:universal stress protein [Halomicroarcula nitratireducens]MBX0297817.1 universal stress protein [Halomicroarcula nitratireducens]
MYDRILIPTDGSDVAEAAAEAAIAFAGRFEADLHIIHVLEVGELPPGFEDEGADEFASRGKEAVSRVAEMATNADVDVTTAILENGASIHRAILTYASDHGVDCIVMGTYGRTGLDRFVLGSVAEQTLREAPVPVMTVHEDTVVDPDFSAVLVPTDGSACAQAAADHAIELALATDAALHIVHVVDLGVVWDEVNAGVVLDALEEAGKQALQTIIDQADESGVATSESSVLSGAPHSAIVEYADERDVDCVVMGSHGRTGIDRYLLGSVTERVVRLTDVPVLALKEPNTTD